MFEPAPRLLLGLLTGFLFGFFLQKARVTKFDVIVNQFRFKDFTVLKVMLTAIVTGGAGVYLLRFEGLANLHVKPAQMVGVVLGGLIFGVGMAVLGYCPGTGLAAAAEGSRHALWGVLGMLLGAAVFAEMYAFLSGNVLKWADFGKITLPDVTGVPAWAWLAGLALVAAAVFALIERFERRGSRAAREKRRRLAVNARSRLTEATVADAHEDTLFYSYTVRGVQYSTSQDVTDLHDYLPGEPGMLVGPATVKYVPENPANSILVCEEWSGLRRYDADRSHTTTERS